MNPLSSRIGSIKEKDGTLRMDMTIVVIDSEALPPFPEPPSRWHGLSWYALFGLAFGALYVWMVR